MKKFFRKLFAKIIGIKYVVNLGSNEIHDLNHTHKNCNIKSITNFKYISKSKVPSYLSNGFNGCRWCYKSEDEG